MYMNFTIFGPIDHQHGLNAKACIRAESPMPSIGANRFPCAPGRFNNLCGHVNVCIIIEAMLIVFAIGVIVRFGLIGITFSKSIIVSRTVAVARVSTAP